MQSRRELHAVWVLGCWVGVLVSSACRASLDLDGYTFSAGGSAGNAAGTSGTSGATAAGNSAQGGSAGSGPGQGGSADGLANGGASAAGSSGADAGEGPDASTDPSDDAGTGGSGGSAGTAGSAGSGGSGPSPTTCNPAGNDCEVGEYCDATDCSTLGVCTAGPLVSTTPTMIPACGCDGTSYWNVEHAHWLGATAFATDYTGCGAGGTACSIGAGCASPGSTCVVSHGLGAASCTDGSSGSCWAIPAGASCAGAPTIDVGFSSCRFGPADCNSGDALTYCEAVLDGDYATICL